MTPTHDKPLFFIHVMKTAGTTLKSHMRGFYRPDEVYPNRDEDEAFFEANVDVAHLVALPAERKRRIRVYTGHFPYVATELLDVDTITMTVLRDPVERVVSHLRQVYKRPGGFLEHAATVRDLELPNYEQLYDDPHLHPRFFANHQCRMFALTADDDPLGVTAPFDDPRTDRPPLELDEGRLAIAKEQLAKVDVVGLTEDFEGFCAEVTRRFGIPTEDVVTRNQAPSVAPEVSDSLRARITEDNQMDVALYEHAVALASAARGEQ